MRPARSLLIVAASLALVITACSQPLDSQTPRLAPQFGTLGQEFIGPAAVNSEGIYLGGSWDGEPALIKYTRAGRLPWVKFPKPAQGEEAMGMANFDGGMVGVELSASGHIHVLQVAQGVPASGEPFRTYYLSKYAPNGSLLWKRRFATTDFGYASALSLDGNGNHYVLVQGNNRGPVLHKHNAKGTLLRRKSIPEVPSMANFVATPDGSVYVAHEPLRYDRVNRGRLIKYDSAGRQVWERNVPFMIQRLSLGKNGSVFIAGYAITYIDGYYGDMVSGIKLARYTSSGGNSWTKTVADWTATAAQRWSFWLSDLATDAQDGAYVGIQKAYGYLSDPESLTLRKYSGTGARAWSRTFELRAGAALNDVAVLSPSEVYLAGNIPEVGAEPQGTQDGFLLRLNGQGERVWMR